MNRKHNQKTRLLRRFITIFAVFTLLFCYAGCSKKTPREALEDAYKKTFVTGNPTEKLLGMSEINAHVNENKAHSTGFSLRIQEISGEGMEQYSGLLSGLGLSVDSASDLLNRKGSTYVDITYGGTPYLTLGTQIQGSKVHVTAPQLLDGSLSVDLSTLEEDLASDSMLGKALRESGISLPENFTEDLLNSLTSPSSLNTLVKITAACNDLDKAITVEKLNKKAVAFPSEIAFKNAYCVTIPKYAYVAFINAVLDISTEHSVALSDSVLGDESSQVDTDLLNTKLQIQQIADAVGDIKLNVAVTKKGYISYAETKINAANDSYTLTASFTGKTAPLTDVKITFNGTANGETLNAVYEETFDQENNEVEFTFTAKEEDTTLLTVSGESTFTDTEKGKKYGMDFDYLEIETEDFSLSLAGDYYVDTTACEITAPTGTEYNLLRMSDSEFTALLLEVLTNLQEDPLLSQLLGSLDFGM